MVDDYNRDDRRRGGSDERYDRARRFERARRRYDEEYRTPRKETSTLGVIAFVMGLLALVISLIPCFGAFAIFAGGIPLVLALASVLIARGSNQKMGFPVAATAVSGSAVAFSLMWLAVIGSMMDNRAAKRPAPPLPVPPPPQVRVNPPLKKPDENKLDDEKFQKQLLEDLAKDRIKERIRNGPGEPVTAGTLETDYLTNVVAAESRYKDKVLEVTGKVVRVIREDGKLQYLLELDTGEPTKTVNCEFNEQTKHPLTSIKRGQEVKVRGQCVGRVDAFVTLKDCVLAK
ncbi:hypothetical protein J8F10_34345 [Gemmata sp. G18]|uniref:tRNA_anti-like n=1 Tax=Gemmata palustris TaxID=2822762 RepID=A0ABS5C2Y4_9BACT|nr:hypothetical protein [Gemmata palustris]MBP3960337.1 hypothetical protein [Gemmata palustris]